MRKIGCHISSAGGISKIFDRAKIADAECLQTFAGSPQTWKPAEYSDEDVEKFKTERVKNTNIGPLFIHAMYLINLASPNNQIRHGSINALVKSLMVAEKLGFDGVITHTGSAGSASFDDVLPTLQKSLGQILEQVPANLKTKLLLENAAGAGGIIGGSVSELSQMLKSVGLDERIGFCIDTCHAFVSGYDLRTDAGISRLATEIESDLGWNRLKAIHLNDSKGDLGSKKDRHEIVGKGYLGLESFKKILHHPQFSQIPMILETPDLKSDLTEPPESLVSIRSLM
ncbi:MAG: deoxyribonuclease IV [Patescibacteria group bacterium]|jgi:deoxyribonuclease-4